MLKRYVEKALTEYIEGKDYKTFYLWGPRRSGKTTLLNEFSQKLHVPVFNFDFSSDHEKFTPDRHTLGKLAKAYPVILIDEVQNYPQATIALKLLHDEFKTKVIATGSSELRQKGKEFDSQAGRFTQHYCLPLSLEEIKANTALPAHEEGAFAKRLAEQLQIFGSYPEVYTIQDASTEKKIELLENIIQTYVLKDVVNIYELKNEKLARDILTKIALQLGSEVSVRELAASLGSNGATVANYIEIFIKNYILIPLPSFRTNARRAVSENRKLYFYDMGIRNAFIKDFRETSLRQDQGGLFENFIVLEIEKQRRNMDMKCDLFFYREYGGKEIDLIVADYFKRYKAVEIKVKNKKGNKDIFPLSHTFATINAENYFTSLSEALQLS